MAEKETGAGLMLPLRQPGRVTFWRLCRWGAGAVAAVSLALLIGYSDAGMRRIALAFSNGHGSPWAQPVQPLDNGETARLTEQLRLMISEQNRLFARLETLERNLNDLTGSIAQSAKPALAPENVAAPPAEFVTPPQTIPSNVTPLSTPLPDPASPARQAPVVAALAQDVTPAETSATAKVEFGVDLGSAPTVEALRTLWVAAKGKHAALLEGMRPIVTIRENARPGSVELRLVAGPIPSAAAAARMCVAIATTGSVCQPAVFDGQRLAMR